MMLTKAVTTKLNPWVQATPDYARMLFLSQGSGPPDPARSADAITAL